MSDTTGAIICFGIALVGLLYLLRGSRRARLAEIRHARTAAEVAGDAAAQVVAVHGMTAWVRCADCGTRCLVTGLTPQQLTDLLNDPAPTCADCVDELIAEAEELVS